MASLPITPSRTDTATASKTAHTALRDPFDLSAAASATPKDTPLDAALSQVRPVIERLDGAKDVPDALEAEEPDEKDRALQASEAYRTLREPDMALTPVGIV
ncbi:hypothetical protein [uncultured Algimonas sp.]|uniref:hypothetical protein n=1 Tax=uncultured Algimonas sp. TaxID=1547920 RepID=UPI00260D46B7|nr:hypothetical protein [uncultured Algimonas sp.]